MAGVGDEQLSELHVRSVAHPAGDRDRGDSKSPQGDWLPDGVGCHSQPRAKLGGRNRGLLGQLVSREPLGRRLTPYACVEHLASHRRLADEGAGPSWLKGCMATLCSLILCRKLSFREEVFSAVREWHRTTVPSCLQTI